jgi:cyclic beta-1,2-glucan synthetase
VGARRLAQRDRALRRDRDRPGNRRAVAQNSWSNEFCDQIAFADLAGRQTAWTADRAEFLGRNGTLDRPLGLAPGVQLSNRVGAGLDPCGALQAQLTPDPGGSIDVIFFLGESAAEPRPKR